MRKIPILVLSLSLFLSTPYAVELNDTNQNIESGSAIIKISPPSQMENEVDPDEYILGVGDQFIVEMLIENTTMIVPVLASGELSIRGLPKMKVQGKTLSEVLKVLEKETGDFVNVSLYDVKKLRIPVSGALKLPGIYSLSAAFRLSDLLKYTHLRYLAKDYEINIISGNDTNIVNIYEFNLKGDLKNNPYLHAGERIYFPFADPEKECVEVYGPVMAKSFVPFIQGESLGNFYRRKIIMSDVMNYEKIMVSRGEEQINVPVGEMNNFLIEAGDKLEFIALKRIMISGHVNKPGTYEFIPGHTVMDYISMAGGANYKGSANSAIVIRDSKKIRNTDDLTIKRGDIILVKRSAEDIFIGEISILQFVSMIASIASTVITAFIAAGNI